MLDLSAHCDTCDSDTLPWGVGADCGASGTRIPLRVSPKTSYQIAKCIYCQVFKLLFSTALCEKLSFFVLTCN